MNLEQRIKKEWTAVKGRFEWSDCLETVAGERVSMLHLPSPSAEQGYPYLAIVDFGTEIGMESYNAQGEWNVGVKHPMNLRLKTPESATGTRQKCQCCDCGCCKAVV